MPPTQNELEQLRSERDALREQINERQNERITALEDTVQRIELAVAVMNTKVVIWNAIISIVVSGAVAWWVKHSP